jgi:hypothetical protein
MVIIFLKLYSRIFSFLNYVYCSVYPVCEAVKWFTSQLVYDSDGYFTENWNSPESDVFPRASRETILQ